MKKKRRLKKSIKNIITALIGVTLGVFCAFRTNAAAPMTNISVTQGTKLISDYEYFKSAEIIKVELPDGLLQIGFSAFEGCTLLKHINLPDGLTALDNRSFAKCRSLTDIELPQSLVYMGNAVFYGCDSLESITVPGGIMSLENNLFYDCSSLKNVEIPDSVVTIGQQTFYNCTALKSITLPQNLTTICDGAFYNCSGLETITIPDSVTMIGTDAFEGCEELSIVANEGSYAYEYAKKNGLLKNKEIKKDNNNDIQNIKLSTQAKLSEVPKTGVKTHYLAFGILTLLAAIGFIMINFSHLMKKRIIAAGLLAGMLVLSSCASANEEEKIVYLTEEESASAYEIIYVQNRDVVLTQTISCSYTQTSEQKVSFNVGGKRIDKVYVHAGDVVKRGDVLAELAIGTLEEDIKKLEYDIEVKKLQESYLDTWENFELEESYNSLVYRSGMEEEDVKQKDERDAQIKQNYDYKREDYEDDLEFDNKKLAKMKSELSSSRLYATMSGTVLKVEDNVEGSTSKKDEVIMTIIDGTDGMFTCEAADYAEQLKNADTLALNIVYGDAKGDYEVAPYNTGKWGKEQYFIIVDGPDNEGIEVGTTANLTVQLDRKDDVPSLPKGNVYTADGKKYVYVLDESGMKTIKWIETGLEGDEYTEIVSGLSSGEAVVRR